MDTKEREEEGEREGKAQEEKEEQKEWGRWRMKNILENRICNRVTPCTKPHIEQMEYLYFIQNFRFQSQILCIILSFGNVYTIVD